MGNGQILGSWLLRRIGDRYLASVESNLHHAYISDVVDNVRRDLERSHFRVLHAESDFYWRSRGGLVQYRLHGRHDKSVVSSRIRRHRNNLYIGSLDYGLGQQHILIKILIKF